MLLAHGMFASFSDFNICFHMGKSGLHMPRTALRAWPVDEPPLCPSFFRKTSVCSNGESSASTEALGKVLEDWVKSGDLVDETSMPDDSNWPKITFDDYCANCRCVVITRAPLVLTYAAYN